MTEDEYLVLETRLSPPNNTRYDLSLPDSGLAVWHIIESWNDNGNAPPACPSGDWSSQAGIDNARRGIRLVRPTATFSQTSLWDSTQYDLDASGFSCNPPRNVSQWADGSAAFAIRNFSDAGEVMTFDVEAP